MYYFLFFIFLGTVLISDIFIYLVLYDFFY